MKIDVLPSGIWQMSSTVVSDGGECLVVDPGYFPREIDDVAHLARARGATRMVAFTHGHWDHVLGWPAFPGAEIVASPTLAAGGDLVRKNLADAREFDGRWYVYRDVTWPPAVRALPEGAVVEIGRRRVRALGLPGHSPDGLALLVEDAGTILVGDYLSPCEIPFVEDLEAYRQTLRRLLALLADLREVIPGHGPRLTATDARAIAAADLRYLDALAIAGERGDAAAAAAVALPRAADVPGMRAYHDENCAIAMRRPGAGLPP